MRAVAYRTAHKLGAGNSFENIDLPKPVATGRDLLVEIKAISVNPVDTKVRVSRTAPDGDYVTLGYDAAGIVREVGADATLFKPGDEVFYAGVNNRPGTNAEFHLVDERIVGFKPKTLGFAEAAAMPLTSITAYEALFDRLRIKSPVPSAANAVLIIGGAGGVGSIAVQLVRQLTDLTVIATASRPETFDWVKALGAHHVIDHSKPMPAQIAALGVGAPAFVFSTTHSDEHAAGIAELISPQGRFGLIDDFPSLDIKLFKSKAVSIHWEFMFTRPVFQTADMIEQHKLLNHVAELVDDGKIRTTLGENFGAINAENIRRAHAQLESQTTKGKIVLEGF